jgi:phage tail-like protein
MTGATDNFRYLNREGRWRDFDWRGLEVGPDGALRLFASPRRSELGELPPAQAISAPAGLARDARGRVFHSVPSRNELWFRDDCAPDWSKLTCSTESEGIGSLGLPRGLCVLERSRCLLVVDAGQHGKGRLLFLDLNDFALREVWGGPFGPHGCRDAFREPWSVAADADENLFVLDHGRQSILKFSRSADRDHAFTERLRASGLVTQPTAIAVAQRAGGALLFVADRAQQKIRVFDALGEPVLAADGSAVAIGQSGMGDVLALAVDADTLYVGDNLGQRLLTFRTLPGFPFAGDAVGFAQPTAALACDGEGGLLVHIGGAPPPVRLEAKGAFVRVGTLWSGPIRAGALRARWGRLQARLAAAPGAHLELFCAFADDPADRPEVYPDSDDPFSDDDWTRLATDITSAVLPKEQTVFAFVGARFTGNRSASVALEQLRIDFDVEGYERYLPAIYREPPEDNAFLHRYLALFQSVFDEIDEEIATLAKYFDAAAAPVEALPWLASWLAAEIDRDEPVARLRSLIAGAYRRHGKRGTAEGLRAALLEEVGVHATISEPLAAAEPFWMPAPVECGGATVLQGPALGFGTSLASAEAGGAVLGGAATLDRSYLITDDQFGEPLFESSAHQFIVEVYQSEVCTPAKLARVRAIIDREKPAHTLYRLEVLDSGLSVGHQARVGVDTLLGGSQAPSAVGQTTEAFGLRLAGQPGPRVGQARLGQDIRLRDC